MTHRRRPGDPNQTHTHIVTKNGIFDIVKRYKSSITPTSSMQICLNYFRSQKHEMLLYWLIIQINISIPTYLILVAHQK